MSSTVDSISKAYSEGYSSFGDLESPQNPYLIGSKEWASWNFGWSHAQEDQS